jgi:hypothetical protein
VRLIARYLIAANSSRYGQYWTVRQSVFQDLTPKNPMPQQASQKSGKNTPIFQRANPKDVIFSWLLAKMTASKRRRAAESDPDSMAGLKIIGRTSVTMSERNKIEVHLASRRSP